MDKVAEEEDSRKMALVFYSKSAQMSPGLGKGERMGVVEATDKERWMELEREFPHFRRMLSNFFEAPIRAEMDGEELTFATVEHLYQASKFRRGHPSYARMFSLESDSVFCRDPERAKAAGGKRGVVRDKKKVIFWRPANVMVDGDFFTTERHDMEMREAQWKKFAQHPELMRMLRLTGDAILLHAVPRSRERVRFVHLESIRSTY